MNTLKYNSRVSAILSTLPYEDAQNIRHALNTLLHEVPLGNPSVQLLAQDCSGKVFSLAVRDYRIILKQADDSLSDLEVADILSHDAILSYREAVTRSS